MADTMKSYLERQFRNFFDDVIDGNFPAIDDIKKYYDVIVAASDSSEADKKSADVVCDGTNDEVEIEQALNHNIGISNICRVLLCKGTYYLDSFTQKTLSSGSTQTIANYAICVNTNWDSQAHANKPYRAELYGVGNNGAKTDTSDTKLIVTDTAISNIDNTKDNVVIGFARAGSQKMGFLLEGQTLKVDNLYIYTNGTNNRVIGIDGSACTQMEVTNCSLSTVPMYTDIRLDTQVFADVNIGIRGTKGSCYGVRQILEHNRCMGFKEGLAIIGEHFIVQDCVQHSCYYGFTIGNYDVTGKLEHPNVFIGNSVEQCYQMGLLTRAGTTEISELEDNNGRHAKMTIIYIGGSTESTWKDSNNTAHTMKGVEEIVNGAYSGQIETDFDMYIPVVFRGGKSLGWKNLKYPVNGTSADRPAATTVQKGSYYFDTTLGKPIFRSGNKWVDATGQEVT